MEPVATLSVNWQHLSGIAVSGIFIIFLVLQNRELRRSERELMTLLNQVQVKTLETISSLEKSINVFLDRKS